MNLRKLSCMLLLLVALVGATSARAEFRDFAAVINNGDGTLLTSDELVQGTAVSFGVAVAEDGTVSRVAADATDAVAVISGKYHSDHGLTNFVATLPVEGSVEVVLGQCTYGGNVTITDAEGSTVATFTTKITGCYKNDASNLASVVCEVENPTTLTISGGNYVPYFAVKTYVKSEAVFRDFSAEFNAVGLLTEEEVSSLTQTEFGLTVAEDGTVSRVAADAVDALAVVRGAYHSEHGMSNGTMTVHVEGPVKVGIGNCNYGTASVKDAGGNVIGEVGKANCYHSDPANNITYVTYAGEATTLTISAQYLSYVSVVAINEVIETASVSYAKGLYFGAEGTLPATEEAIVGEEYTLPATNIYLYNEGFTLTGWNVDGETYPLGATFEVTGDVVISPVFTANEVSLADRTEAVSITYNIIPDKGAPSVAYQGKTGIMIAQTVVNGKTIDVKMDIDATNGKFATNGTSWVQVNTGTKIIVPACKGAVIDITAYSVLDATTIEGKALNSGSKTPSYTCVGSAETVEIVVGENTYFSNIVVTLPVVEKEPESTFRNIVIDNAINLLTEDEIANQTSVTMGVAVAEDGSISRVEADDESAAATISGAYHSEHGIGNAIVTVPVEGTVKIGVGNCKYGTVKITDAEGNVVMNLGNAENCYHQNTAENITYGYYKVDEATTLTCSVTYLSYLSVVAIDPIEIPTDITVSYLVGEATGIAPKAMTVAIGGTFTIPANRSLYVEGKTLVGWSDGVNTYTVGQEVAAGEENIELSPLFAENTVTLADRSEAVTLEYYFGESNGLPSYTLQGANNGVGIVVVQATIAGETIDVKMDIDATAGKFSNAGRGDKWAQVNNGTIFTVPSCKGATISMEAYNAINATTVDGVALESDNTVASFTCAGSAEKVEIVVNDGSYYSYVKIVMPVVQADVQIQERGIIMTDFTDWTAIPAEGGTLDVATNFSNETITFTFDGVSVQPSGQNTGKFGDLTGFAMAEKNANGTIETTSFKNITRVRYFHGATGSNRGFKLEKKSATDTDWVVLSDAVANPATGVWVECAINEEEVQLRWTNIALSQNAYMFELEVYANVEITAEQVTLALTASPEEGGSVSVYPQSEQYDIDTEVTLTAKENFGYDFVNWTDADGNVVGETAECKYVVAQNSVVTANFVAVDTYKLVVNVEGGANDYMVNITPEPAEVDGMLMYEAGTVVTLTATNNPILTFSNWASGETTTDLVVTMDADKEVTAVYGAVDYLVGWDFIKSGKNSRAADFVSSSDNENTVLVLRNAEGNVAAWLDKSQEAAGGYEGKPAAVNWQQLTDKYYYQTKVNALNFTDIKVQAELLYNFIAYEVQVLEYSLDGETWKEVTRVTLPAAKAWTLMEATLPAECNNVEELYIRWIPDYTSNTVGTESKGNDGTAITNIFVTGRAAIYDDGTAPVVVSTVPADNAADVSATGRIVVNFDEKVQVNEGTMATLGDQTIAPVVSGRVLTFNYMGLDYNTAYTFTLPANTVSDLAGNTLTEAVTLSFTTVAPPTVQAGMYDVEVTDAAELLTALATADGETRFRIFLHEGTYDLGEACLTNVKSNISLIGENMENTVIVNKAPTEGIGVSATLLLTGSNIYMQDLTIKNAYDYIGTTGRAVCIQDKGDKNIFKNVRMLSYQDTYYTNNSKMRAYHENTEIHGTVDFICGGGDVFFNQSTLYLEERSSANCITAPNGDTDWGYVFSDCVIDGHEVNNGQYNLGRPWNGTPRCVWLNTTMKVIPSAAGWTSMQVLPELFAEYNSVTESGNVIDLSGRTTTFTVDGESVTAAYNPVLTAEEAAQYTIANVLAGDDQWQPNLLTEQAITPDVAVAGGVLTWDASDYVFCYAVCRNGKVVAFTNETEYVIPADATNDDFFGVRAANEMGGLSIASQGVNKEGVYSGIANTIVEGAEVVSTMIFTIDGMLVPEMQDGINIVRKAYSNGVITVEKVVCRKY